MKDRQILVVDDEPKMRRVLEIMLQKMGHKVFGAGNGREALEVFAAQAIDLVITDLRMPEMDGIALLAQLRAQESDVPVMVITAHGTIETAVTAMKHGACDYILRPFDIDALELAVGRALNGAEVARQNAFLREEIGRGWDAFIGTSQPMQDVYSLIQRVGPSKASVLIVGETGTGKELAARAVHNASPRREQLFVPLNCAAIPADILESELFGYEKGAFTGAVKDRVGKFELADGGTIFLDEVGDLHGASQAKLLRVLQEGEFHRVGGEQIIRVSVRVISATNRDLAGMVTQEKFREDLYYRLSVVPIRVPALRERPHDVRLLAEYFLEEFCTRNNFRRKMLDETVFALLESYAWPGNARELRNVIERMAILTPGDRLTRDAIPVEIRVQREAGPKSTIQEARESAEREHILRALEESNWNVSGAARTLGMERTNLHKRIRALGLARGK